MALDKRIVEALRLENLSVPRELPVEYIHVEEYVDSDGDDALRVSVILSEDFDEDKISGEAVGKLKLSILDSLIGQGIQLYPYVWLMKPSDLHSEPKPKRRHAQRAA